MIVEGLEGNSGRVTLHEVFSKRFAVVDFVAVSGTDAETGKVLIEVDKQHLRTHGVDPS